MSDWDRLTRDEFNDWMIHHCDCFPRCAELSDGSARVWYEYLRTRATQAELTEASTRLFGHPDERPKSFDRHPHALVIAIRANYAAARESRKAAEQKRRAEAYARHGAEVVDCTLCYDTGRVAVRLAGAWWDANYRRGLHLFSTHPVPQEVAHQRAQYASRPVFCSCGRGREEAARPPRPRPEFYDPTVHATWDLLPLESPYRDLMPAWIPPIWDALVAGDGPPRFTTLKKALDSQHKPPEEAKSGLTDQDREVLRAIDAHGNDPSGPF